MSNHTPASIDLGGSLSDDALRALYGALEDDGAALDWNEHTPDFETFRTAVETAAAREESLTFYDTAAGWGRFDAVEATCREWEIPYTRSSDAFAEYDAEVAWWTPGMTSPKEATGIGPATST